MDIGPLLADSRRRAGLTQRELAERAGTSQAAVARIEAGRATPSLDTLQRLLGAAGFRLRLEIEPVGEPRADAVVEAYKRDVDRSLLRENLRKSVDQRLRDAEATRKSAARLRAAVRSRRP